MNDHADPELIAAIQARRETSTALDLARDAYFRAKADHAKAKQRVEEILNDLIGDRPLLAAIQAKQKTNGVPFEPTACYRVPMEAYQPSADKPRRGRPRKLTEVKTSEET